MLQSRCSLAGALALVPALVGATESESRLADIDFPNSGSSPLWAEQDISAARSVLSNFKPARSAWRRRRPSQDPPSGPASPIKPSHELYGQLLAKTGKHSEAIAAFRTSMSRTPNRAPSLLGLARSSAAVGDMETAHESYEALRRFLKDADPGVPFLKEVRNFEAATDAADN